MDRLIWGIFLEEDAYPNTWKRCKEAFLLDLSHIFLVVCESESRKRKTRNRILFSSSTHTVTSSPVHSAAVSTPHCASAPNGCSKDVPPKLLSQWLAGRHCKITLLMILQSSFLFLPVRLIRTLGFTASISASCRSNSFVLRSFTAKWMKAGGRQLRHGRECRLLWHCFSLLPLACPADAYMQPNTAHHSFGAFALPPLGHLFLTKVLILTRAHFSGLSRKIKKQAKLTFVRTSTKRFLHFLTETQAFERRGKLI